ncbi:hypothetical protein C2845_PM02G20090 [Panicum miliaceum]|uniref:Uncharacterized protein n=1 Tax=Panicum miliaceum TaxID=4540 RepID=A0A3L6SFM5_PANMI|nr:hypothetical protein C2845_PM02G20090 [Panicum miliaceum]
MVVRVCEVLNASQNKNARSAYLRVLSRPTEQEVAQKVICLLLWLETSMGIDVLNNVAAMAPGDTTLTQVVMEAEAVYSYLLYVHPTLSQLLQVIPTIVALSGGGRLVDFRFFKFHRGVAARGVIVIEDTVAALVFDDNLHAMLRRFPNPVPAPELMAPFVALKRTPSMDSRTVFFAFPGCHPLSSEDIKNYFERRPVFGRCIEHIAMEQPLPGQTAKHGVIVFRTTKPRATPRI